MRVPHGATYRAVPLGGLGTGYLEVCDDGRFRNLTLNNNRTAAGAIPLAPHSFLAVRASSADDVYLRRLQTPLAGEQNRYLLPPGGLQYRGLYPQADFKVIDPSAPLEMSFGAYASVVPYDYEASSLPLIYIAIQMTNKTEDTLEISTILNWQNTCGQYGAEPPDTLRPIARDLLITEEDWEQAKGNEKGDNERRLRTDTGRVDQMHDRAFYEGEIAPNALIFGDHCVLDQNEDSEYCVVSRWQDDTETSQMVWDGESSVDQERFWGQLATSGLFDGAQADSSVPRCGALCCNFTLAPGESRTIEYIVSWYGARYEVGGAALGNFYTNAHSDAVAVAKTGLLNGAYYHASVEAWRKRLATAGFPHGLVQRTIANSDVLSTNTLHAHNGAFGFLQGASDPRMNYVRDRWYWSMAMLLFYPRIENESMERISEIAIAEDGNRLVQSEGMERFGLPEYVGPGAAQVEAGASLVTNTYRNYLFAGNLPAVSQIAPRLQKIMTLLLTQDKNVDGFPDIQAEAPRLDDVSASGLNVITAGIWLVALHACEALIKLGQMTDTPLYHQARKRAEQSFDRYFWNEEHGYYTLYPAARYELGPAHSLNDACHAGQLTAVWMADVMGFGDILPKSRITQVLDTLQAHNVRPEGFRSLSWPARSNTDEPQNGIHPDNLYDVVPYVCVQLHRSHSQRVYEKIAPLLDQCLAGGAQGTTPDDSKKSTSDIQHPLARLALWYVLIASPVVQVRLAEKSLVLSPDQRHDKAGQAHILITPRGFGEVHLSVHRDKPFRCAIKFSMDVPLELTSIHIRIDQDPGPLVGRFDLPEGEVPIRITRKAAHRGGVVIQVHPSVNTPASSFELLLGSPVAPADGSNSKKQWIPHWLRRSRD